MKKNFRNAIVFVTAIAILGFGVNALAHESRSYGKRGGQMGYHGGQRGYHMGENGSGYGTKLSDEDVAKMEKQMQTFFNETKDLRDSLYEKNLALRSELVKRDIDRAKAAGLQKEISNLNADLDQKRIDHMLKVKEINPDAGRYMGSGRGMGRGRGMGNGMTGGGMGYGRGNCGL